MDYLQILLFLGGFTVVAVASHHLAKHIRRLRLPVVTGLIIVGILSGPFVFRLIPKEAIGSLGFITDFALAFIAFAAGAELYLKELRSRFRSITWITASLISISFLSGTFLVYYFSDRIPFMSGLSAEVKAGVALLTGVIFIASSPALAIAVITELRAKGPFTQTAMGVTVIKDVLVIILFSVSFAMAKTLVTGQGFDVGFLYFLLAELAASLVVGLLLGRLLALILLLARNTAVKTALVLLAGYGVFVLSHFLRDLSGDHLSREFFLEPLLTCIIGSFIVTNYSRHRVEFLKIITDTGPPVYVLFFTLTGASMSLDILLHVWPAALLLFGLRLLVIIAGGVTGGLFSGDGWKRGLIAWMPYVAQAGVGLGLTMAAAGEFTDDWGREFATVIIAVIILNEIVGPPLFKWSLTYVGEDHSRAERQARDGGARDCIIFGLENQSIALARQLRTHGWQVKIATRRDSVSDMNVQDIEIRHLRAFDLGAMKELNTRKAEAIVTMLSDEENYHICELAYEHFGTKDMIVRLNKRVNFDRFHKLGALIVEPSTAIVSLLDHFVRSPQATSLLLGMAGDQDTIELEVHNPDMHGLALRNLRLPADVIILSVTRAGQMLISHGYTRLRMGDMVTLVGSNESLQKVRLRFEGR